MRGKVSEFEALVTGEYDVAIDLRTDTDTRILLERVRARIKVGIGSKAQFNFLDIFLPIDGSRRFEAASATNLDVQSFSAQNFCRRSRFEISSDFLDGTFYQDAIVWGPYRRLPIGRYIIEPFIIIDWEKPGLLRFDIALDNKRVVEDILFEGELPNLEFTNAVDDAALELRFWAMKGEPSPPFRFYGGKLYKQGASSVLHQSEYLLLLIELTVMRVERHGLLNEFRAPV